MADEIISRADARARGLKHYFTGKHCKHGHTDRRNVSDGSCMACSRVNSLASAARNPEKTKERRRRLRLKHRDKDLAYKKQYRERNREPIKAYMDAYHAREKEERAARREKELQDRPELRLRHQRLQAHKEAKAQGLTFFESLDPCPMGHTGRRYASNGDCVTCHQEGYEQKRLREGIVPRSNHRAQARAAGLSRYNTGRPCKNGHYSDRSALDGKCFECARLKALARWREDPEGSKERDRIWRQRNKERIAAQNKARRERDVEATRAKERAWKLPHREKARGYMKRWREQNPDWDQLYRQANRAYYNAKSRERQARKTKATPPWYALDTVIALYEEARRLTLETGIPHHIDHVVPLQNPFVCGLHTADNLQILPASENFAKNNSFDPLTYAHEIPTPQQQT